MLLWFTSRPIINSHVWFWIWNSEFHRNERLKWKVSVCAFCFKMDESGIDMGFDLASLLSRDFSVDQKILEEMTAGQQQQDFMFYELKSKAVPITER